MTYDPTDSSDLGDDTGEGSIPIADSGYLVVNFYKSSTPSGGDVSTSGRVIIHTYDPTDSSDLGDDTGEGSSIIPIPDSGQLVIHVYKSTLSGGDVSASGRVVIQTYDKTDSSNLGMDTGMPIPDSGQLVINLY